MLETRFSETELTTICKMLREHGTNCATLVEILKLAYDAYPNDAMNTYRHVILLKEFGLIKDKDLLCNVCVQEVIDEHSRTCLEYKKRIQDEYFFPCSDDHYDYSRCSPAVWMTDWRKIGNLTKDRDWNGIIDVLNRTFPDMPKDMLHNHPHFLCEKHVGSMKEYANEITGYDQRMYKNTKKV